MHIDFIIPHIDIGTGVPILFIHGLGSRKEAWISQHSLAPHFRLIIPDLRGHGENTSDQDISLHTFASDLINLLDAKGIKKAFICGLSLGGMVAQELFYQRPDLVKGLILANTTSYIIPVFAESVIRHNVLHYKDKQFLDHILDRGLYNKKIAPTAKAAFLIRDTYLASSVAAVGINYFPLLSLMNKPVLLIGSSHDKVTPILNMWAMKMFLPLAKVKVFWKCGHLSNIERSDSFNKAVEEFINQAE